MKVQWQLWWKSFLSKISFICWFKGVQSSEPCIPLYVIGAPQEAAPSYCCILTHLPSNFPPTPKGSYSALIQKIDYIKERIMQLLSSIALLPPKSFAAPSRQIQTVYHHQSQSKAIHPSLTLILNHQRVEDYRHYRPNERFYYCHDYHQYPQHPEDPLGTCCLYCSKTEGQEQTPAYCTICIPDSPEPWPDNQTCGTLIHTDRWRLVPREDKVDHSEGSLKTQVYQHENPQNFSIVTYLTARTGRTIIWYLYFRLILGIIWTDHRIVGGSVVGGIHGHVVVFVWGGVAAVAHIALVADQRLVHFIC